MAAHCDRPVILPMSNPTSLRGDAGRPDRLDRRPGARGHRQPVRAGRLWLTYQIGQANNALVFPGLGLGVIAARAHGYRQDAVRGRRRGRARLTPLTWELRSSPLIDYLRGLSTVVAAGTAQAAAEDGVARSAASAADLPAAVERAMWGRRPTGRCCPPERRREKAAGSGRAAPAEAKDGSGRRAGGPRRRQQAHAARRAAGGGRQGAMRRAGGAGRPPGAYQRIAHISGRCPERPVRPP